MYKPGDKIYIQSLKKYAIVVMMTPVGKIRATFVDSGIDTIFDIHEVMRVVE